MPFNPRALGQGIMGGAQSFMNRPRPQMPGPMQGRGVNPTPGIPRGPMPGMGVPQGLGAQMPPPEAIMKERLRRQPPPRLY
jgi:hypothetical protein